MMLFKSKGPSSSEIEKAFSRFDTNNDGHLSLDELVAAAEQARNGRAPVRERIASLLSRYDRNGNGTLEVLLTSCLC